VPLAERLQDEQRARRQRGERVLVEAYLARHPDLAGDAEAVLDLIYNEVLLRKQQKEHPKAEEYLRRFPHLSDPIRDLFEVDSALDSEAQQSAESTTFSPREEADSTSAGQASLATVAIPGYETLRELGRGGMGVVYCAWQNDLRRVVAIKTVLAGAATAPEQQVRFQREAEAVARLQHPNIVQIYQVGLGSSPYLVLEHADGGSLAQKLDGTPQPPQRAALLVEVLARAAHHAHQKGIIHRDLKPANVLLLEDGTPKISDFGLAKFLIGDDGGKTRTGEIVGTPSYMAPELGMGRVKDVGPWTDVYALGAILYELLTGRPPFKGATPFDTIAQAASDEPVPPIRVQPKVPRDLETICLKCLDKEPRKRYASALALAEDLRRFLAGEPARARRVGLGERALKWVKRRPAAAVLVAVSGLAALALVGLGVCLCCNGQLQAALHEAEEQRAEANRQRKCFEDLEASTRYLRNISQAEQAWQEARIGQTTRLLKSHPAWPLGARGRLDEAIAELREAIRLDKDYPEAHCALGQALCTQGRFREAVEELRLGHELGSRNPRWPYPSAQSLRDAKRLADLDARLPALLRGQEQPKGADERLALARLCQLPCKALYTAAARWYSEAFAAQPGRADDLSSGRRYNAARAGALAGCGQGKDAEDLGAMQRLRWRRQALTWLHADLRAWQQLLAREPSRGRPAVVQQMQHWLADADFNGVRGAEALGRLPAEERAAWVRLWADVTDLLAQSKGPMPRDKEKPDKP
jgi:tetratricopeptide (TPR) repeat protein